MTKKALSAEEKDRRFAEDAWLNYFNRYLFITGTISAKEYRRMTEMIAVKKTRPSLDKLNTEK